MRNIFLMAFLLIGLFANAQVPISSYSIINKIPAQSSNSALGWIDASSPYNNTTTYTMFYGYIDASTVGINRTLSSFSISAGPSAGVFEPVTFTADKPFDTVVVKRVNNPDVSNRRVNALYEYGSFDSGSDFLYLQPPYSATMEDLINTQFINIGSDNSFANTASTANNIERIDLIFSKGIGGLASDLDKIGILINERSGNDNFKIAAITGIDGSYNVTGLGNLISVSASDWGSVGPSITTVVMSKNEADPFLRPKQDIGSQTISGVFVSLQNLGISGGTLIQGVSLFPNDVTSGNDLLGLSDVPLNTDGPSDGGLDLMAGSGFYKITGTLVLLPLKFIDFSGKFNEQGQVDLEWSTFNDDPVAGTFFIERSDGNSGWYTIGQFEERFMRGLQQLSRFVDYHPGNSQNYYRIRHRSADGKNIFSKIVNIRNTLTVENLEVIYASGSGLVRINSGKLSGKFAIRIYDMRGRLMSKRNIVLQENSIHLFNLKRTISGSFIIEITQNGKRLFNNAFIR